MTITEKEKNGIIYLYDVKWDPKTKNQVWFYMGRKTDQPITKRAEKYFSEKEIESIRYAYERACANCYGVQRDAIKLLCYRIGLSL